MKKLTLDIIGKCNLVCEFCYQTKHKSQLSSDDIFKIVDKYSDSETIEIGGGEPFLHQEILKILSGLAERKKSIHIATNGTVIPDEFLKLEERLFDSVQLQVSVHASNSKLYKEITTKDYFDEVISNIKKSSSVYQMLLTSTTYPKNIYDAEGIVSLAEKLKLPIRFNLAFPFGKAKDIEILNEKQLDYFKGFLIAHKFKKHFIDSPLLHKNNCYAIEKFYGIKKIEECPLDYEEKAYINPAGETYDCEFVMNKIGDKK